MVQKYVPRIAQQGPRWSDEPPQGAGTPGKPRDIEHLTKVRDKLGCAVV